MTLFDESTCGEIYHTFCVASLCKLLAAAEGLNMNMAEIIGLLHDSGRVVCISPMQSHAETGSEYTVQLLQSLGNFADQDIKTIANAILTHTQKKKHHGKYNEILKNADLFQRLLSTGTFEQKHYLRIQHVIESLLDGAVRLVLQSRYDELLLDLDSFLHQADIEIPEDVHKIRIKTKRILVFLKHYRHFWTNTYYKNAYGIFKSLIKTLGNIRNIDITCEYIILQGNCIEKHESIIETLRTQRTQQVSELIYPYTIGSLHFKRKAQTTFRLIKEHDYQTLTEQLKVLNNQIKSIKTHPQSSSRIHKFKINARTYRYTLDVMISPTISQFKKPIRLLKITHPLIGIIQDLTIISETLEDNYASTSTLLDIAVKKKNAYKKLVNILKE